MGLPDAGIEAEALADAEAPADGLDDAARLPDALGTAEALVLGSGAGVGDGKSVVVEFGQSRQGATSASGAEARHQHSGVEQ